MVQMMIIMTVILNILMIKNNLSISEEVRTYDDRIINMKITKYKSINIKL